MIQHRYKLLLIVQVVLIGVLTGCNNQRLSNNQIPGKVWMQYETPEEAGFSATKLDLLRDLYDSLGSAALLVVYKGNILIDWGETSRRFKCHSVRKSLLSALFGIYIDNNQINVNKTLAELGIDDQPYFLTETEKTAKIVDLLSARSGIYLPAAYEPARNRKPPRGAYPPGAFWCYNNWDFNTLLTIFEQETGKMIFEEFNLHFAEKLHMEHFHPSHGYYHFEPEKSMHPAYPFRMSARDLARFGLLYLNKGRWGDQQILSEAYINKSTSLISFDSISNTGSGYGYMWWVSQTDPFKSNDMYSALGSGEHSIDIIPGADIVFVHRPNTYLWQRITYQQQRRMIKLLLEAKVDEPKQKVKLIPVTNIVSSYKPDKLTEEEMENYLGTYLNDGDRFPFKIEKTNGRLTADFGEGKVNLYMVAENHFILEDWNDDVYLIENEIGTKELICIITLLKEGDYYLNKGELDKASDYYLKAKKYYSEDPRIIICLDDIEKERNK
jgi:CubicO group peptidase (beta-lactamase class C family)